MAKYRVRAETSPGHAGLFRGGRFWPSSQWTTVDLTTAQARILESDPRLMIEVGDGPKNAAVVKNEALEIARELDAEKTAHGATSAKLSDALTEIDRLTLAVSTAKKDADGARAETEAFKERIRADAKAADAAEAEAKAKAKA